MSETHWAMGPHGNRIRHEGEIDDCAKDNCPKGKATTPEGRVRLTVALYNEKNTGTIGGEILYDKRFESEDWPRTSYPLLTRDIQSVLYDLDEVRGRADSNANLYQGQRDDNARLHRVIMAMAKDLQERDKEITGLMAELHRCKEVAGLKADPHLNEKNIDLARENAQLRSDVTFLQERRKQLEDLVKCLKRKGGNHHFRYGYQKIIDLPTGPYVDHCADCDKPKGDPSHFGNGVNALSSKDVEEAVQAVHDRLLKVVEDGLMMKGPNGKNFVRELLAGLPGLPEA